LSQPTERFSHAVEYARAAHHGQVRKGTRIPYLSHLLGVASLVMEYGGSEDQAIAGLLHDLLEDCGEAHEPVIRERFGEAVAAIVRDCTDGSAESKGAATTPDAKRRDWQHRKETYLQHLAEEPEASLLVGACDKLHNARAIVADLENPAIGVGVFERFTAGRTGTLWYYARIAEVLQQRNNPVARAFAGVVARMEALANAD